MFFSARGLLRVSLGVSIAAYAAGVLLAGTVTVLGSYRVISAILAELAARRRRRRPSAAGVYRLQRLSSAPAQQDVMPGRHAFMTPLRAGGLANLPRNAASMPSLVAPAGFGSSSRYWGRPARRDRDADDEDDDNDEDKKERPREAGTYRTLCVRLCDGYYFPISFSATRDRFARDAKTCETSCGGQARLFVYRNPGFRRRGYGGPARSALQAAEHSLSLSHRVRAAVPMQAQPMGCRSAGAPSHVRAGCRQTHGQQAGCC